MALLAFFFIGLWTINLDLLIKPDPSSYILLSRNIYLLPESKMYLKGKTNLNNYTCSCNSAKLHNNLLTIEKNNKVIFNNALLEIATTNINCHNSIYNYNVRKSLNVTNYPSIKVELLEAWKKGKSNSVECEEWFDLLSLTKVTIRNKTLIQNVEAKASRITSNKYRIISTHTINMNDYDIKVPEIMFGLIQIENKIDFHFDLILEIT